MYAQIHIWDILCVLIRETVDMTKGGVLLSKMSLDTNEIARIIRWSGNLKIVIEYRLHALDNEFSFFSLANENLHLPKPIKSIEFGFYSGVCALFAWFFADIFWCFSKLISLEEEEEKMKTHGIFELRNELSLFIFLFCLFEIIVHSRFELQLSFWVIFVAFLLLLSLTIFVVVLCTSKCNE